MNQRTDVGGLFLLDGLLRLDRCVLGFGFLEKGVEDDCAVHWVEKMLKNDKKFIINLVNANLM